jgi:hypothetical protein
MIKELIRFIAPGFFMKSHVAAAAIGGAALSAGVGAMATTSAANTAADAAKSSAQAANSPWSAAQPYVQAGFQPAQDAMNAALTQGAYTGQRAANLDPYQTQGANSTAAYAQGNGINTANQFYNSGTSMMGSGQGFGNNAQTLFNQAQGDPTQGFLNTANSYANNPYTSQMIDAANTDVQRELNQQQLPTLALNAAQSGNTDSTRTGVQSAIMQSQAQQNMLNNASTIRGNMFNTGLNMAQSQYNTQQQQALNANTQMGNAYTMGGGALINGQQANGNNFDQMQGAGGVFQNQNQQQLTAQQQQWQDQLNTPLNILGQYQNVIGGKWGGQAVSSVGPSTTAAAAQGLLGGGALGAGVAGKLGDFYNAQNSASNGSYYGGGFSMPAGTTDPSYGVTAPAGVGAFGY